MINYFRTGMALEVQWKKKNFQYMYIFASKFLCIPMNISSKPAHSQFIWSKKEPARNKGSQKLFVTIYKKQNIKKMLRPKITSTSNKSAQVGGEVNLPRANTYKL